MGAYLENSQVKHFYSTSDASKFDVTLLQKVTAVTFVQNGVGNILYSPVGLGENKKIVLCLISQKPVASWTLEERAFLESVTSLVALCFKLQETQGSLTQITKQVYEMNAQLHSLDKLKDDFVSIASHELRTPMTAIRSYVWMALNKSDVPLSDKLKRYLTRTLSSTERLINLVNEMLNISRIESGRVQITPKSFDIKQLSDDVVSEVGPRSQETGVNVQFIPSQVSQVFADPDKVHQVLLNLVGNSLKFTPKGGSIQIILGQKDNEVVISIKDTGSGLSKEDIQKLFKKFGRLDNSYVVAGTSGGTGLGLYISKNLVDLMKGRIWAESQGVGKGATFSFTLPIATQEVLKHAAEYATDVDSKNAKPLEAVAL